MGNLGDEDPGPSPYSDNYLAVFAATTIQKWFRGYRVRKAYKDRVSRKATFIGAQACTQAAHSRGHSCILACVSSH